MTAVSQSYPNYLGGLNEQPDELKKPGQLVEALNVIPDPVIGLSRRPGFELISQMPGVDPSGTWFEMELSNQINDDYIYFGCVNPDGTVHIFNQDGEGQTIKYTQTPVKPHKTYTYNNNLLVVTDEDEEVVQEVDIIDSAPLDYFKHSKPLKYCISKSHAVFTNPTTVPVMAGKAVPTDNDKTRYYSFINLKVIDTENYNYTFRRFKPSDQTVTYSYVKDVVLESVVDLGDRYDQDLQLALQVKGPYRFELNGPGVIENCVVEVDFRGQIVQLDSSGGDGYRNEARYTWSTRIIDPGKGYSSAAGQDVFTETLSSSLVGDNLPDLTLRFKIKEVQQVTATDNEIIVPDDLSNNNSAEDILNDLAVKFKQSGIDKTVVVGNGLYLENTVEFSVSTSEIAVADIINSQKTDDDIVPIAKVNTVAELPVECYAGFIVQVKNSFDEKNDYYLEYKSESESTDDLDITKSDGFWEEIAKPFEPVTPNNAFLPHIITVARESDQEEFVFVVSPMEYESRTAGTSSDNPSMFIDIAPITAINYYKNRLFFFTNVGTVISTRAGSISNMFLDTAVTVSAIDPIDVVANSNQRVPIHGSAVVNNAIVLFGNTEQYSLSTQSDLLTTETVNITKISNYTFDRASTPVYVGTNLGFIGSGLNRFYEMTNVYDRGPVDINERSQQIQTQFGQGFNMPVSSREQSSVFVYKKYENKVGNRDIMLYRFRQENSQESTQTSWVRWRVDRPVAYVSLPQDKLFVVVADNNGASLYRMDSGSTDGLPASNASIVPKFLDGYSDSTEGVKFETRITFPTIYPRNKEVSDITSNVTIHRLKISTAAVGAYNLEIYRKGYDGYNILYEQTPSDEYKANIVPLYGEHVETVPVYTRNKNLNITLTTDYDAPLTLRSMTWEGDWNPPYYKRG